MVHDVVCRGSSAWPCRGTGLRASARLEAARRGSARCATPWCCRLTYLSAVVPPATGSAASVQSGVLPICIPRFAARPIQRQPSLPVLALSWRSPPSPLSSLSVALVRLLPSLSPCLVSHLVSRSRFSLSFPSSVRYHRSRAPPPKAAENCSFPTSRPAGPQDREMTY